MSNYCRIMMWMSTNRYEFWSQGRAKEKRLQVRRVVIRILEVRLRSVSNKLHLIQVISNHFFNKNEATKNVKSPFQVIKINQRNLQCMIIYTRRPKVIILSFVKIFGWNFAMVVSNQNPQKYHNQERTTIIRSIRIPC